MRLDHIPDDWKIEKKDARTFITDNEGKSRCGFKRKNGIPCKAQPMENGRCGRHGGKNTSINGYFKEGKYARYRKQMPKRLIEKYDEYEFNSDDLNNLDPDIIAYTMRVSELFERLEEGDYGASYTKIRQAFYRADLAIRTGDMEDLATHWKALKELIETGSKDYQLWKEIREVTKERTQTVERKMSILTKANMAVSMEDYIETLRLIELAYAESSALGTDIERRKAFSSRIHALIAPMVDHD